MVQPHAQPGIVRDLLDQVAAGVPAGGEVFLPLDRRLAWPEAIRQARGLGR